jgi:hypothetical protein
MSVEYINADVAFCLWCHDNLNYSTIQETLNVLTKANKVLLGQLYVSYRDKKPCPKDLAKKERPRPKCCVCGCILSRQDCFVQSTYIFDKLYCQQHLADATATASLVAVESAVKPVDISRNCHKCGGKKNITEVEYLPGINDTYTTKYTCGSCREIINESIMQNRPKVVFTCDV